MLRSDALIYALAILFGICAGVVEVKLADILLTAVCVLISTLVLGFIRPRRAWRWIVIVGVFVPLARIIVFLGFGQRPYKAQVWASGLGFLTGIAGSYAGAMLRLGVDSLFRSHDNPGSPQGPRDTGKGDRNY